MMWLLALTAVAQEASPADIADALAAELMRNQAELSLDGAPPIYFARYRALMMDQVDANARFGSLVHSGTNPYRNMSIELRVGDPSFDNSGFGGWQNGFRTATLPVVVTPESAALVAWSATDRAYKEAVEQYGRKAAQVERDDEHPGDYTLVEPVAAQLPGPSISPAEPLLDLARRVSGAMAVDGADAIVEVGDVYIGHEAGSEILVDTDGTRLIQPRAELTVRAVSHVRAADGQLLIDERLWTVDSFERLPTVDAMVAEARHMAEHLVELANAPTLDEEYVGPVLFEGEAAADLLRYVLVPQLEGTPEDVPFDSFFGDLGSRGTGGARLSRRVLPLGWQAEDDPSATPEHPGSYRFDAEGVAAQSVSLVDDGIVQDLFMSRTPRADLRQSNGHARGGFGSRALGRPVALTVTPEKNRSKRAVAKRAKRLARAYDRDWIYVVTSLQEPSAMAIGDYTRFPRFEAGQPTLPPPVALIRRYADGREEWVRGAGFTGVQRFILRDIAAAGPQHRHDYLIDGVGEPASYGATSGLPTWVSAPDMLIGEMELVPMSGDPRSLPVIPAPDLTAPDLTSNP